MKKIEVSDCISKSLSQPNPWCPSPWVNWTISNYKQTNTCDWREPFEEIEGVQEGVQGSQGGSDKLISFYPEPFDILEVTVVIIYNLFL